MRRRYWIIGLLLLAAAIVPTVLTVSDPAATAPQARAEPPPVPPEAVELIEEGRNWRASELLDEYLAQVEDPAAKTILLAARADAGWGNWRGVARLLDGRPWLDTLAGGVGWKLLGRARLELERWAGSERALERYLEVASGLSDRERGVATLRRAKALARADTVELEAALAAYDRAAELLSGLPGLGGWIQLAAARAAAAAGDTAVVRRRLAALDPAIARGRAWRVRVRAYRDADAMAAALDAAERATETLPDEAERAEAWRIVGELRLERADTAGARAAFLAAMGAAPETVAAVHAARALSELPGLTPETRLRIGRLYLRHGNEARAVAGIGAYLEAGLGSALERAELRLDLGRALYHGGRYERAVERLLALTEDAPTAEIGAEALYYAGRAQYRLGEREAALETFRRTVERFPGQPAAAKAAFLVADLAHDDHRLDVARRFYRRTIETNAYVDEAGLAQMRLGGIAFLHGDYTAAIDFYEGYLERYETGQRDAKATYWAARSYRELGRDTLARELLREVRRSYPLSYYALLASERLGEPFPDLALAPAPPADSTVRRTVARAFNAIEVLRAVDWSQAAEFEAERLEDRFAGEARYAVAEALNAHGMTYDGILYGWEIFEDVGVWDPRLLEIIYPFPYREMIAAEARARGLDPHFVAGLIRQESMFVADIGSSAGAIGLMQIIPPTGRRLAQQVGMERFEVRWLEQPELNVLLGTRFLSDLMERFEGRVPLALSAYNAGPNEAREWKRVYPEFGRPELFTERIPFGETRHYVKVVQKNAQLYEALYPTPSDGAEDDEDRANEESRRR